MNNLRIVKAFRRGLLGFIYIFTAMNMTQAQILKAELQDSQPKYIIMPGQIAFGICPEIYNALNDILKPPGIQFSYQSDYYTPFKRLQSNLKTGLTQVFCGAARTPTRERDYIFSATPLYPVSRILVGRKGGVESHPSPMEIFKSSAIIVSIRGSAAAKYLNDAFTLEYIVEANSIQKALELVRLRRADYFFYHDLSIRYTLSTSDYTDLEIIDFPTARYDHYMIYSKQLEQYLIEQIENALISLEDNGTLKAIHKKYIDYDGS